MPIAQPKDVFEQFTTKAIEGLTLWADANQKVLRQLVDFSTASAAESLRVHAELQTSAIKAVRSGQEYVLAQQGRLQEGSKDPVGSYQKGMAEGLEGAKQAFELLEASAQAMTRSAERLQQSAEETGRKIQATLSGLAEELKVLYAPVEKAKKAAEK